MKIATEVVWQMTDSGMDEVSRVECDYEGQLALCGGGPSSEQKAAAASQANLSSQLGQTAQQHEQFFENQQNKANPFYQSRMDNGLPYYNAATDQAGGITAGAFQPARAALETNVIVRESTLRFRRCLIPRSRYRSGPQYDDNLMAILDANERAKQAGASGILGQAQLSNPLGYYQGSMQGNQSILQAPLQKPGLAGMLGGLAGGAASAFFG
jgi:hypothetical protein